MGRPKGSLNKTTSDIKAVIERVFQKLGGYDGLLQWAEASPDNKDLFYTKIWAKLIPRDFKLDAKLNVTIEDLVMGSMKEPEKKP